MRGIAFYKLIVLGECIAIRIIILPDMEPLRSEGREHDRVLCRLVA